MDWMTAAVVIIGLVIFCVWTVLPVREFAGIFRHLKAERQKDQLAGKPDDIAP